VYTICVVSSSTEELYISKLGHGLWMQPIVADIACLSVYLFICW